jgi:hypothetical protein
VYVYTEASRGTGRHMSLDATHLIEADHCGTVPVLPARILGGGVGRRMSLSHPHAVAYAEARRVDVWACVNDARCEHRAAQREPPAGRPQARSGPRAYARHPTCLPR